MLLEWLSDSIFSIREHTMVAINKLGILFGNDWVESKVLPSLLAFENNENYLFRQIPLIAFRNLHTSLSPGFYSENIFPVLSTFATDKIINIRMNVSRVILTFAEKLKGTEGEEKTISLLNALKNDPEFDVSYFAKEALRRFG